MTQENVCHFQASSDRPFCALTLLFAFTTLTLMKSIFFFLVLICTGPFSLTLAKPKHQLNINDFIAPSTLEREIKTFCLNQATSNRAASVQVRESTQRNSNGYDFESIRFDVRKKGVTGLPDCSANRELIQLIKTNGPSQIIYDSGFLPEPYCENPVRHTQAPMAYLLKSLDVNQSQIQIPIVLIESVSSTLPCPDVDEIRSRRFMVFDLTAPQKLLLEFEGDLVVPEIGENPYRLHFVNVSKVYYNSLAPASKERPISIEIRNGKLELSYSAWTKNKEEIQKPTPPVSTGPITLNSIYSKDLKMVYIKTTDKSGPIKDADPASFQILSHDGDSAYTKDAKRVYFYGDVIPNADASSFIQLNDRYGKDLNHVYHMDTIMDGADISSFIAPYANVWYARDKDHVYSGSKVLQKADPESFSVGEDRSCGRGCSYRSEDKQYRFDSKDQVVQKLQSIKP